MDIEDQLLAHLNPEQAEAVRHHGTPLLIVAGAGSGKTRVITHRIAYLNRVIGIPLWQILAVTFTNKAAREMRERVCNLLGVPDDPSLAISTFHSRCVTILRRESEAAGLERSFAILDDRDQMTAVKKAMEQAEVSEKEVRPGQAHHFINLAKMKLLTPEDCIEEFADEDVPYPLIYKHYEEILRKNNSLDFEDLIFKTVQLFREHDDIRIKWNNKFRYVMVDEFQDTNHSQMELVKLLVGPDHNVCVVGDEDQAIYSWRGADVQNLLQFKEIYPETRIVRLEQNYRSVGNVLKAASGLIKHNTMRIGKELWTEREEGELLEGFCGYDDQEEGKMVAEHIASLLISEGIPANEIAVFYRSHALARVIEDALMKFRIPYRIIGGTRFYDRAEVKDVLSFMRLAVQPANDLAFERVMNVPTRGVGPKTQSDIRSRAAGKGISYFQATRELLNEGEIKGKARAGLEEFLAHIQKWYIDAPTASCTEILKDILAGTRYKSEGIGDPNSLDGRTRLENVEELEAVVQEFEMNESNATVDNFLQAMALDAQREEKDGRPKVSLMTVHNAKGLEFDYVFIVALEQGIFPNSRTFDKPEEYEEERRLFYVALTRARKKIYLSRATRRMRSGMYESTAPSNFLFELPADVMTEQARQRLQIAKQPLASPRPQQGYGNRLYGSAVGTYSRPAAPASGGNGKDLREGDRVNHKIMGPGVVTKVGGRFGNERVYVEFDDGRGQEFILKYAPLVKID